MKNVLRISILFLAVLLTACSEESDVPKSEEIQKTNVAFSIDQPTESTTAKQIKRGALPVWVNTITLKAESTYYTPYSTSDTYTFDEQNGASDILLDGVAIKENKFIGTTTSDSPKQRVFTTFTSNSPTSNGKFSQALDNIDNENPYVVYYGKKTQTINTTGTNSVAIPMNTINGRVLSVFQVTQDMRDLGIQAKITATVTGEAPQEAITKGSELVTFKWSDESSIKDKVVTFKVEISEINKQNVILKTYTVTEKVRASTSLSCLYLIDTSGIVLKRNDVKIILNFQKWKNETCSSCPVISEVENGNFWLNWSTQHWGN